MSLSTRLKPEHRSLLPGLHCIQKGQFRKPLLLGQESGGSNVRVSPWLNGRREIWRLIKHLMGFSARCQALQAGGWLMCLAFMLKGGAWEPRGLEGSGTDSSTARPRLRPHRLYFCWVLLIQEDIGSLCQSLVCWVGAAWHSQDCEWINNSTAL